eukprot:1159282-Pelagomonas_calceolata.AAC.11
MSEPGGREAASSELVPDSSSSSKRSSLGGGGRVAAHTKGVVTPMNICCLPPNCRRMAGGMDWLAGALTDATSACLLNARARLFKQAFTQLYVQAS